MPTPRRHSPWRKRLALVGAGAVVVVAIAWAGYVVAQSAGWVKAPERAYTPPDPPVAASFGPEAIAGPLAATPEGLGDVVYLLPNDADRSTRLFEEDLPQQLAR